MDSPSHAVNPLNQMTKPQIRERMRVLLTSMVPQDHEHRSDLVCRQIMALPAWTAAQTVQVFAPLPFEIDIAPVAIDALAAGKRVYVPRVDWATRTMVPALVTNWSADLLPDRHGLLNPRPDLPVLPLAELNVLLVPGLAFDRQGNRLGRGGGFYDRLLSDPAFRASSIGICYATQLLNPGEIPTEPGDRKVEMVVFG